MIEDQDITADIPLYAQYGQAECLSKFINIIVSKCFIDRNKFFNDYYNLMTPVTATPDDITQIRLDWWGSLLNQSQYNYSPYINNIIGYNQIPVFIKDYYFVNRSYDGVGTYYNNQVKRTAFTLKEYRILLINAYKLQYTACTLGRLLDYLHDFFDEKLVGDNPNKSMKWRINIITKLNGREIWEIVHNLPFINETGLDNQNWYLLFSTKTGYGGNRIMPLPVNVQWALKQETF
jgi:hypothetical protein